MKKEIWLVVLVGFLFCASAAFSQITNFQKQMREQMQKKMRGKVLSVGTGTQPSTPALATSMKAAQGKAIFNDSSLGTNGKSCGSCHVDGQKPLDGREVDNRMIVHAQYHYEHSIGGERVMAADKLDKLVAYFNSLASKKSGSMMFPTGNSSQGRVPNTQQEMEDDQW